VACTGFYRANRHVQLSRDMLIIKTPQEIRSVAFAFDDQPVPAHRPLSSAEKAIQAIAFTGEEFAKLPRSHKVRIEAVTAHGTVRHELDLRGLAGALENINAGCPATDVPVRRRPRS